MRLRPYALSFVIVLMFVGLSKQAEASAILFTDRTAFDAALNGDYELFTDFPPNDLSLISVQIIGWTGGGVRMLQDVSESSSVAPSA